MFFADPNPWQWKLRAKDWEPWFHANFGQEIAYSYALPETFADQVRQAEVMYIHGGDNDTLMSHLKGYHGLAHSLKEKVVIGSSAGANYLSAKFWTRNKHQVGIGSGMVPCGVMVHYGSLDGGFHNGQKVNWQDAEQKLRDQLPQGTDVLRIEEGAFYVIEV